VSFSQSTTEFISSLKARKTPFTPPGVLQSTIVLGGKSYEIWRSSIIDKKCRDLLSNIQIFVLLYIEGGNSLALDDEEWTNERWDVFFLYERTPHGYGFIGYSTVYCYFYFDINNSDLSRVRLSQFIILPPYQRAGLGSRFYDEIFHVYLQSAEVREITVEDPSEEFSDLRDRCDMARLGLDKDFKAINIAIIMQKPRPMLNQLRERFKMPCRQFLRCVEMKLLRDIDTTDKKAHKAYRLFVKSRIYKQHIDVLSQLDRLERIDKLDETFHHQEDDYKRLLTMMESTSVVEVQDDIPSTKRVHEAVDRSKPVKRAKLSAPDREP
jgi:histone acetyltransferase 1